MFDLVNNYLKNNLDAEINADRDEVGGGEPRKRREEHGEETTDYIHDVIDIFRIQGETKEFLTLLEETQGLLDISAYLVNIRKIEQWMKERGTTKPPSTTSKDPEEKKLGKAWHNIDQRLINPYKKLETEEERQLYREKHPELEEVMEKWEKIGENNISTYLVNIRKIEQWMKERGTTKPPSEASKDPEEKKLGQARSTIAQRLIKPYMELETEEERKLYREKNPELDEVAEIYIKLGLQGMGTKARELVRLIQEDLEKRKKLQQARELEKSYKAEIDKLQENEQDRQNMGEDIGE